MKRRSIWPDLIEQAINSGKLKREYNHAELNEALKDQIPPEREVYFRKEVNRETGRASRLPVLLFAKSLMTGDAIKTAIVQIGGTYNEPYVSIELNAHGSRVFDQITRDNVNRQLAIVLDQVVQSAPVIQERISGGKAQITGSFSMDEASDLAIVLRAGALPAPVHVVQNVTVGPSLGLDSIQKGFCVGSDRHGPGDPVHVVLLPVFRFDRRFCLDLECNFYVGRPEYFSGHLDPARHRRHHSVHRYGGGFQRPDL